MANVVLPQVSTEMLSVGTLTDTPSTTTSRVPFVVITGDRGPHNQVVSVNSKSLFYKYFGKPNMPVTGPGHYIVDNVLETLTDKVYVVRASVVESNNENDNDKIANVMIGSQDKDGTVTSVSADFNFRYGSSFVYVDHEALVGMGLNKVMETVPEVYSPIGVVTDPTLAIGVGAVLNASYGGAAISNCLYTGEYPFYIRDATNSANYKITKIQKLLVGISPTNARSATQNNFYYQLTVENVSGATPWYGTSTLDPRTGQVSRLSNLECRFIELDHTTGKIPSGAISATSFTSEGDVGFLYDDPATTPSPDERVTNDYCFVIANKSKIATEWEAGNVFVKAKSKIAYTLDNVGNNSIPTKFFFKEGSDYAYVIQTFKNFDDTTTSATARAVAIADLKVKMESLKGRWLYPTILDNAVELYPETGARQITKVDCYNISEGVETSGTTVGITTFKELATWSANTANPLLGSTINYGLFPKFVRLSSRETYAYNKPLDTGGIGGDVNAAILQFNSTNTYGDPNDTGGYIGHGNHLSVQLSSSTQLDKELTVGAGSRKDNVVIFVAKLKLNSPIVITDDIRTLANNATTNEYNADLEQNIAIDDSDADGTGLVYFATHCYDNDPYVITSDTNKSKFNNIRRNQTNNILTFVAIGTGAYYNNIYITATRNTTFEKYSQFVNDNNESLYPYNFVDLKVWEQNVTSASKLLESFTVSLLPTDDNGDTFKDPNNGHNISITGQLNQSRFIRCYYGKNIEYLRNKNNRANLITYLSPNQAVGTVINSFSYTYGGLLLAGGENGCMFETSSNLINIKHPEVTKTLISIFDGTCFDATNTIANLDEYINPIYRFNYIVTGGYDYNVNIAAMMLADKRQDCLCISDVGIVSTDNNITPGAFQDRTFVQSMYAGIDTPHAAIYSQPRNHNDIDFTNGNVVLPATYYALYHNMNVDNRYFVSEPVAGNPKTADTDAPIYQVNSVQQQGFLDARCNPTVRENGRVSYILDELTMRKKYDSLSYIHCVKFLHLIKVELSDMLRPYLKRKLTGKYLSEIQSLVNSYLSKYSSDVISEKLYSLTAYTATVSVDDSSSTIIVNLELNVVKGINAIKITLNVQ